MSCVFNPTRSKYALCDIGYRPWLVFNSDEITLLSGLPGWYFLLVGYLDAVEFFCFQELHSDLELSDVYSHERERGW